MKRANYNDLINPDGDWGAISAEPTRAFAARLADYTDQAPDPYIVGTVKPGEVQVRERLESGEPGPTALVLVALFTNNGGNLVRYRVGICDTTPAARAALEVVVRALRDLKAIPDPELN